MKKLLIAIIGLSFMVSACDTDRLYEANTDFENQFWMASDSVNLTFPISKTDTSYTVFFNVRNSNNYPYHNLFIKYWLIGPEDDTLSSSLEEFYLFDKSTGQPFGSGIGDIFEHRMPMIENVSFPDSGNYKIVLQHYMRPDTLKEILSAGFRLEYTEKEYED